MEQCGSGGDSGGDGGDGGDSGGGDGGQLQIPLLIPPSPEVRLIR